MTHKTLSFFLSFALLLSLVTLTNAAEQKVRVTVASANVRLKPDLESSVISKVPKGTELIVEQRTGTWYRIKLPPDENGFVVSGYIHESVVEEVGAAPRRTQRAVQRTTPPPAGEPAYAEPGEKGMKMGVGLRAGYAGSGPMFGAGLNIGLMKYLGVSLGASLYWKSAEGEAVTATSGTLSKGKTMAIPVQLNIQGRFPVSPSLEPYIEAGVGFFLNSFTLDSTITDAWNALGYTIEETLKISIGFQAGAGVDYFFSESLALNLDFKYCTTSPKGTWTITDQVTSTAATGDITDAGLGTIMIGLGIKFFF